MASATLIWEHGTGGEQTVKYKVYTDTDYTTFGTVGPTVNTAVVTGISLNTLYDFKIVQDCTTGAPQETNKQGVAFTCPNVTISSLTGEISFPHLGGTISAYTINLYNEAGNVLLDSATIDGPFGSTITKTFSMATPGVNYKIRVIPRVGSQFNKVECPFVAFNYCACPQDFTIDISGDKCVKAETQEPNIFYTDYCLAASQNDAYSSYFTRVYNVGWHQESLSQLSGLTYPSDVYVEKTDPVQWRSTLSTNGPMNRAGVWLDSNCDGTKDGVGFSIVTFSSITGGTGYVDGTYLNVPLNIRLSGIGIITGIGSGAIGNIIVSGGAVTSIVLVDGGHGYRPGNAISTSAMNLGGSGVGFKAYIGTVTPPQQITVAYAFNNTANARTVYVGVGGDNFFTLKVNTVTVASVSGASNENYFKIWHVFPVDLVEGMNYFNLVATGDGSVNDAVGMTIYDNTAAEIAAAANDSVLEVMFSTADLRGSHIDVATCNTGWDLDTSGGTGNYVCRRTSYSNCSSTSGEIHGVYGWSNTDPYTQLLSSDNFEYQGSTTFLSGGNIVTDVHTSPDDQYYVLRYPATEPIKNRWTESSFNYGSIPDSIFRETLTIRGYHYVISVVPNTFSHATDSRIVFSRIGG